MATDVLYHVTGVYAYSQRRFKTIVTSNRIHAMSINLWRGTVWEVRNGKRRIIKREGW